MAAYAYNFSPRKAETGGSKAKKKRSAFRIQVRLSYIMFLSPKTKTQTNKPFF